MSVAPVLLDTNVASFLFSVRPEAALYHRDLRGRRMSVCFQSAAELMAGADIRGWGRTRRRALSAFLATLKIVHTDADLVQTWAHLRAALSKQGRVVATADMWIAAAALRHDLLLVAHDAVFRQIAGLKLVCHA
ncbi:MAG: PIN domain-containing protein [Planctomycetota bacterium]|nr:PIN domain-containing protein [Planctomycetota bacterium]